MRLMSSLTGLTGLADVQFGEPDGVRREVVALGFVKMSIEGVVDAVRRGGAQRDDAASGLNEVLRAARWFELENTSRDLSPGRVVADVSGEFDVSVPELQLCLDTALGMGMGQWTRILWHSHYRSDVPSGFDLEHFPQWLCDLGVVYYAPSMSSVLYSAGGVLDWPRTHGVTSPLKAQTSTHATV